MNHHLHVEVAQACVADLHAAAGTVRVTVRRRRDQSSDGRRADSESYLIRRALVRGSS